MILLAGLLAVAPAAATAGAPPTSLDEAVGEAVLMGCVLHSVGASPIVPERKAEMAAAGLRLEEKPPAALVERVMQGPGKSWGTAHYAHVPSSAADLWAIGFANGDCLVQGTAPNAATLSAAMRKQFETPGVPWQKLPPTESVADRYGMAVTPPDAPRRDIVVNLLTATMPDLSGFVVATFELAQPIGK